MCDQKLNIQFVQEVQKRPLLYDTSLPEYTRRDLTEAAWEEIGKVVNLTGGACKERWKNLKTVYYRNVKRCYEEPVEKKKKYYLMGHMDFVLPYMKPLTSNSAFNSSCSEDVWAFQQNFNTNTNPESQEEDSHSDQKDFTLPIVTMKPEGSRNDQSHDKTITPDENSSDTDPGSEKSNPAIQKVQDSKQKTVVNNSKRKLAEKEPEAKSVGERQPVDPNVILEARKMFLLGLVDEVAAMTESQMRRFKRDVLKLIDVILEKV